MICIHLLEVKTPDTFEGHLTKLVNDFFYRKLRGRIFNTEVKHLLSDAITDAYVEGVKEGGVRDLTDEMSNELDGLVAEQFPFVDKFVNDAEAIKNKKESYDTFRNRIETWGKTIKAVKDIGYSRAKADEMVTWVLGNTEEHCSTCLELNGQTHPRSWFLDKNYVPGMPGSATACKGFNCDCSLV